MTLGAGPLVWLFNKVTPYYHFYPDRPGSPIFSIWYNIWYCIGALLFQGNTTDTFAFDCLLFYTLEPNRPKRNAYRSERSNGSRFLLAIRYRSIDSLFGKLGRLFDLPHLHESNQHSARSAWQQRFYQLGYSSRRSTRRFSEGQLFKYKRSWHLANGPWTHRSVVKTCHFQTSEDPKLRGIYEGAILHDKADDSLLSMIRDQQHVYIEWKTNLQWLMKQDFLKTNSCDFSLGLSVFS